MSCSCCYKIYLDISSTSISQSSNPTLEWYFYDMQIMSYFCQCLYSFPIFYRMKLNTLEQYVKSSRLIYHFLRIYPPEIQIYLPATYSTFFFLNMIHSVPHYYFCLWYFLSQLFLEFVIIIIIILFLVCNTTFLFLQFKVTKLYVFLLKVTVL